ncbi:2677_t:CDS:2, partial [Acaulospora colombiana]
NKLKINIDQSSLQHYSKSLISLLVAQNVKIKYQWDKLKALKEINENSLPAEQGKEAVNKGGPQTNSNVKILPDSHQQILQILYPTLIALIQKLPALSVAVSGTKTSKPLLIQLEEINILDLVTFTSISSADELEKVLEEQHDTGFDQEDESKPLWRIKILIFQ